MKRFLKALSGWLSPAKRVCSICLGEGKRVVGADIYGKIYGLCPVCGGKGELR